MLQRIGLARIFIYGEYALISTVLLSYADLPEEYETMVLYEKDGEEIESRRTYSLKDAKAYHNKLVHKYNDMIYENSIAKYIGAENYGQFVDVKISC